MFWNCPKFKRQQDEWYQKLNEVGFNDIERIPNAYGDGSCNVFWDLSKGVPSAYMGKHPTCRESMLDYYLLLSHGFDNEKNFATDLDRIVMAFFCDGMEPRQIVRELAKLGIKRHRKTMTFIRRRYEHKWGVRKWTRLQMTSTRPRAHTK